MICGRVPSLLFSLALAFALAACGSSSTTSVTAPSTNTRCQLNLTGSTTSFGPGGGSGTLNVGVSRECTWTATSQTSWISIVSGGDGQGDGTVSFRVAANADPVSRSGALQVSDQRMQLSQAAAPCSFDVSQPGAAPAPGGGRMAVDVRTHPACSWSATSDAPFRIYNIGNNAPVGLSDFIAALEAALGKPAIRELLPMQPGDVRDTYADSTRLARAVNWRPATPVARGVARFVDWYRDYYGVEAETPGA